MSEQDKVRRYGARIDVAGEIAKRYFDKEYLTLLDKYAIADVLNTVNCYFNDLVSEINTKREDISGLKRFLMNFTTHLLGALGSLSEENTSIEKLILYFDKTLSVFKNVYHVEDDCIVE